jgi:uncharacterized repeat protein (TIGR03803 family)
MRNNGLSIGLGLAIFTATLLATSTTVAQESVLHNFNSNGTDGAYPQAGLVIDTVGNLYGTTNNGGTSGFGTVFELTPAADGSWTEKVLHSFGSGADGANPQAGLIFDAAGNLYGTTYEGGTNLYGTAFELTPAGGGNWTEKVLYNFGAGTDAAYPGGSLIFDAAGNLYGITTFGGPAGSGTVFELTPAGGGWTEHVLHNFNSLANGIFPYGGLTFDATGNLYGTTSTGGTSSGGTVFKLTSGGTASVLHNFGGGTDGAAPYAGLIIAAGNLYGTTSAGGTYSSGTLFELTPAGGGWTETVLHSFGNGSDGATPYASLIIDVAGNLYGTTLSGGAYGGGTAFRYNSHGVRVLHSFGLPEGYGPVAPLASDPAGKLYGTANFGGTHNYGTVFEIIPPLQLTTVAPCRLVDTRPEKGGSGPIQGGTFQNFPIPQEGGCNIPAAAAAYSLNVTVVPQGPLNYLTVWPAGQSRPVVSTLNSLDGRVKAAAAIVPAGTIGEISVYVTDTTNVILDINGYFQPVSSSTLTFYPLPPCRVADTRMNNLPAGLGVPQLFAGTARDFPVLNSSCIPSGVNPKAYSLNLTVVPGGHPVGYLSVWPAGQLQPVVSTLNDQTGTIVANAAIVPAGTSGEITVYSTNDTQFLIDINGYFAPAAQGAGLSLYPVVPCRVIDTRQLGPPFSGTLTPPVDVLDSPCGASAAAQAYVFNATVVPAASLGYLTLWPDLQQQPLVSTLNALDAFITNNMAIVPSTNGKVDAYASGLTQLILDISSYFAP